MDAAAHIQLAPIAPAPAPAARLLPGDAAVALCAFLGMGGCLAALLAPQPLWPLLLAVALLALAGFTLGLRLLPKPGRLLWAAAGGLLLAMLALTLLWPNGFALAANRLAGLLTRSTGRIHLGYAVTAGEAAQPLLETLALLPAACLLALAAAALARFSALAAGLAGLLAGIAACLALGQTPPALPLALWVLALVLVFARRGALGLNAGWVRAPLAVLLAAGLLLAALASALPVGEGSTRAAALVNNLRYGRDATHSLPEGRLAGLGPLQRSEEAALEVSMSQPAPLYLRGYVGSEYTGTRWAEASNAGLAEEADLFYWLHRQGFYGQTQLAQAALLLDETLDEAALSTIEVRHLGARRRYAYTPYELSGGGVLEAERIGDINAPLPGPRGQSAYHYTALPGQAARYPQLAARLHEAEQQAPGEALAAYLVNESHYNHYVYRHFLQLPEAERQLLAAHLGSPAAEGAHLPYQEAKQRVLALLDERLSYSEEAEAPSASRFLPGLLEQTREGYSVHYATAAALAFRYFGIPARYVEGYLVTPQDAEAAGAGSTILLDGTHAHAWVEIYQDGIGWVPFEATPPYMSIMPQADGMRAAATGQAGGAGSEMRSDNFEEGEEKTATGEEAPRRAAWPLLLAIAVPCALLCALACWLLRRRRALQARQEGFTTGDNATAICCLYAYIAQLGTAAGRPLGRHPYDHHALSRRKRYAELEQVTALYHEARYSSHPMSEAQLKTVERFKNKLLADIRRKLPLRKRFILRWINFLY